MNTGGHPIIEGADTLKGLIGDVDVVDRTVTERQVGDRTAHVVTLSRTYDAPIDDVWSACTEPERIGRWMVPVTGDLRLGGHYQLEGNAGGEILECEPPERFVITWIFGDPGPDPFSEVEVRLTTTDAGGTTLTLSHAAVVDPGFWGTFGAGAVGVGYDLALMALVAHLAGKDLGKPEEVGQSPEMREFMMNSAARWGRAEEESGVASDEAGAHAEATSDFYAPPLGEDTSSDGQAAG